MSFPRDHVHLPCPHPPGHHRPEHINMYAPGELCAVLGSFRVSAEKPVVGAELGSTDGSIVCYGYFYLAISRRRTVYD